MARIGRIDKPHRMHPNSLKNLEKGKIKKGEVRNPRGCPSNLHVPALKKYTKEKLLEIMSELLTKTIDELVGLINDPKTPALVVIIARAFERDKAKGDLLNLERILDRIYGKATQDVNVSGTMLNKDLSIDVDQLNTDDAKKLYNLLEKAERTNGADGQAN